VVRAESSRSRLMCRGALAVCWCRDRLLNTWVTGRGVGASTPATWPSRSAGSISKPLPPGPDAHRQSRNSVVHILQGRSQNIRLS